MGSYYSPEELDLITDRGQMSYFADIQPKYATSEKIKDTLSAFRDTYSFDFTNTLLGLITIPTNKNLQDILDCFIGVEISARNITRQVPIVMYNEDVRSKRLDSQIDPVTIIEPIGEIVGFGVIQIYPKVQYRGVVSFLRRPIAPKFVYNVISERVIVYDANASTQLEWGRDADITAILIKALASIGINLSDQEISQFAQIKSQQNFLGQNRT